MGEIVADGEPYEPPLSAAIPGYESEPASFGEVAGPLISSGVTPYFERLTEKVQAGGGVASARGGMAPTTPEPTLTADEANQKYAPEGEKLFDQPVTDRLASVIGQQKQDQITRDNIISRWSSAHSWPVRFATEAALSLLDPANDAALMVPGLGEDAVLGYLGKAGLETTGLTARLGAKGIAGATAATAATAPIAAAQYGLSRAEGEDMSLRDAFKGMAINAALGAVLHAGFGTLADVYKARKPIAPAEGATPQALIDLPAPTKLSALSAATSQILDGRPVDVEPIIAPKESPSTVAENQESLYRNGYAAGIPQPEFDAVNGAVYEPKASAPAAPETVPAAEITPRAETPPAATPESLEAIRQAAPDLDLKPEEAERAAQLHASGMAPADALEQMALEDAAAEKHPAIKAAIEKLGDLRAAISGTAQRISGGVQPGGERPGIGAVGEVGTRPQGPVVQATGEAVQEAKPEGQAGQGAAAGTAAERAGVRAAGPADPELALAERELAASGPIHPEDQEIIANAHQAVAEAEARAQACLAGVS